MSPTDRIPPLAPKALALVALGGLVASWAGRGLYEFGADLMTPGRDSVGFGPMLVAVLLFGVLLVVGGLFTIGKREALTIELSAGSLLLPVGTSERRAIPRAEILEIRGKVDLAGRLVELALRSGEVVVINPTLYGGQARLIRALERLLGPLPGDTAPANHA